MCVVDYIIASSNLFEKFSSFTVDNYDVSGHFPLKCSLKLCLKRSIPAGTQRQLDVVFWLYFRHHVA